MMKNIKEFLNTTTEIKHGDRIQTLISITVLGGMALILNNKLFEARLDNIAKDQEIETLKSDIKVLEALEVERKKEINEFEE